MAEGNGVAGGGHGGGEGARGAGAVGAGPGSSNGPSASGHGPPDDGTRAGQVMGAGLNSSESDYSGLMGFDARADAMSMMESEDDSLLGKVMGWMEANPVATSLMAGFIGPALGIPAAMSTLGTSLAVEANKSNKSAVPSVPAAPAAPPASAANVVNVDAPVNNQAPQAVRAQQHLNDGGPVMPAVDVPVAPPQPAVGGQVMPGNSYHAADMQPQFKSALDAWNKYIDGELSRTVEPASPEKVQAMVGLGMEMRRNWALQNLTLAKQAMQGGDSDTAAKHLAAYKASSMTHDDFQVTPMPGGELAMTRIGRDGKPRAIMFNPQTKQAGPKIGVVSMQNIDRLIEEAGDPRLYGMGENQEWLAAKLEEKKIAAQTEQAKASADNSKASAAKTLLETEMLPDKEKRDAAADESLAEYRKALGDAATSNAESNRVRADTAAKKPPTGGATNASSRGMLGDMFEDIDDLSATIAENQSYGTMDSFNPTPYQKDLMKIGAFMEQGQQPFVTQQLQQLHAQNPGVPRHVLVGQLVSILDAQLAE